MQTEILAVPSSGIDGARLLECIGRNSFFIIYDLSRSRTLLCIENGSSGMFSALQNMFPGLEFGNAESTEDCRIEALSIYRHAGESDKELLDGIMDAFDNGFLALAFVSASYGEIESSKSAMEEIASSKKVSETDTGKRWGGSPSSRKDLYYESEERMVSMNIINSLNNAAAGNGLAFRMFAIAPQGSNVLGYVRNRFLVLDSFDAMLSGLHGSLKRARSFPIGTDEAGAFVRFYGFHDLSNVVHTPALPSRGELVLGSFMRGGVLNTKTEIGIDSSAVNLGFLITGLPGSGKTREAMHIVSELSKKGRKIFVITPTAEWGALGNSCGMPVIRICRDNIPINLFGCPGYSDSASFYGNLASVLSSAANAGPYRNPTEKCMLNAFSKTYSQSGNPDPICIYEEIENSIIKFHGRKTNTGVKYTKHGENIRSSLESLRQILGKPQYCVEYGLRISDLENGAIFDLSGASGPIRPQFYALLLNQIYAIADSLDEDGDNELRVLICIEEAQIIFKDPDSPIVLDLRQRIQDFRKKGIGLMLLTHNVNDIDISIRRLCQLKLYMKQAPDNASIAARDLIFPNVDSDLIALKLKTLDSRVGALSIVTREKGERVQKSTVFIRSREFRFPEKHAECIIDGLPEPPRKVDAEISMNVAEGKQKDIDSISICFLGEEICYSNVNELASCRPRLIVGKPYTIRIRNSKSRVVREIVEKGAQKISIAV